MKPINKKILFITLATLIVATSFYYVTKTVLAKGPVLLVENKTVIAAIDEIKSLGNGKWIRCFRDANGAIYIHNHLKSDDCGKTVGPQSGIDVEEINAKPECAVLSKKDLFYAVTGSADFVKTGEYRVNAWRSTDELKSLSKEGATVFIPGGPSHARESGEWNGLYVYRTILELPDGSWLMTMYGNFDEDRIPPQENDAQQETKYMMRTFVVKSTDQGHSWNYLSSVAIPSVGDPIGEGFGEPAITLLDDGRLLCIMRTGHHYPLYASWSNDAGKTWSAPTYTGLDRGCDPCLIKLRDGRVALSWGRRYPEGWSKIAAESDQSRFKYPGEGYTNLAISSNGGKTWLSQKIAQGTGSCYSTIFEVEPNTIFFQVDSWYWRVTLNPKEDPHKNSAS
jgi:hypothetical protein